MNALITGITGQDGSYLAEFLLAKEYNVYGLIRRTSTPNLSRILHILDKITLIPGDLLDQGSINRALSISMADEVYNLAAQSFVKASWSQPEFTGEVTGLGVLRMLDGIRMANKNIKFYQASTSEMFGKVAHSPQSEDTPFYPRSPYGVAKVYGHWITVNYRESYDLFAVSGILFNHESPRRGIEFVSKKIANGVARIYHGLDTSITLGNLEPKRDWGFAGDYVQAMWKMLQQPSPENYVVGSGETHSVEEFCKLAFKRVGLDYKKYVVQHPDLYRPAEVNLLLADSSKAKRDLLWEPKTNFNDLVNLMVDYELEEISKCLLSRESNKKT